MNIYLVGNQESKFHGTDVLPSIRQVLSVFFHKHSTHNLTIHKSAEKTIQEVAALQTVARFPTRRFDHAVTQLKKLHQKWKQVQKNLCRRHSLAQIAKENTFKRKLDTLFDISHHKSMQILKTEKRREFLQEQRSKIYDYNSLSQTSSTEDSPPRSNTGSLNEIESGTFFISGYCVDSATFFRLSHIYFIIGHIFVSLEKSLWIYSDVLIYLSQRCIIFNHIPYKIQVVQKVF